ncbi:uncharacterized protein LOC144440064 [Glandiceps talaboti]
MFPFRLIGSLIVLNLVFRVEAVPVQSTKSGMQHDFKIPDHVHDHFMRASSRTSSVADEKDSKTNQPVNKQKRETSDSDEDIGGDIAVALIGELGGDDDEGLENGASIDIQPQNGFGSDGEIAPPAWHIDVDVEEEDDEEEEESSESVFGYPMGIGPMMFNGCFGSGYLPGDPCYENRIPSQSTCVDMLDAAAFIGVGFDGRGEYSPDSRKMSLIQRNCAGYSTYDGYDVPDTMNVHGIYDTSSTMMTYSERSQYTRHLEVEAGISGGFSSFSGSVSAAYGSTQTSNQQQFMSTLDVDIMRYEIFKDVTTANDLSTNFLKEYMNLPNSYIGSGNPLKYQDFIQRWGTHYVKSGMFGGRLEIQKVSSSSFYSSVEEFAVEANVNYQSIFARFAASLSVKGGSSSSRETGYSSTNVKALGGHPDIAAIVTDFSSPTIKTDLINWLQSIRDYPKAFKFGLAPITDLLYFQMDEIFPNAEFEACTDRTDLQKDEQTGKWYYLVEKTVGDLKVHEKEFCKFMSKEEFMNDIAKRRDSLEYAISIYMSEGLVSNDEISVKGGNEYCELSERGPGEVSKKPDWNYVRSGQSFSVVFEMDEDIEGGRRGSTIPKDQIFTMHYFAGKWFVEKNIGNARLTDGYSNGGSGNTENRKISVKGLVLTFEPESGLFMLEDEDYDASSVFWTSIFGGLKGQFVAEVSWPVSLGTADTGSLEGRFMKETVQRFPCNTHWSNVQLLDATHGGVCLFFSAVSEGTIYAVFSSVPKDKTTWYYVEISPALVAIHKFNHVLAETTIKNARGLGDAVLHQSYFVCVTILTSEQETLIEYGKYSGDEKKITYLTYIDKHSNIVPNFYAIGSGNEDVTLYHLRLPDRRPPVSTQCGHGTRFNADKQICELDCDEHCHPDYGCMILESGVPSPRLCNECKDIKIITSNGFECSDSCPFGTINVDGNRICPCTWYENKCVRECPGGMYPDPDTRQCVVKEPDPWRADLRCGAAYPQHNGSPTECDPNSIHPCCSTSSWCGNTPAHCVCNGCINYKEQVSQLWRDDLRCGPSFDLDNGSPAQCDPDSDFPCCSTSGWCGNTEGHCECIGCINYKVSNIAVKVSKLWRDDLRCGPSFVLTDGSPAQCDPDSDFPCCSTSGWCGNSAAHCECSGCIDYKVSNTAVKKWRDDLKCGESFPLSDGSPAECNPDSDVPCCSTSGWCGNTAAHCECSGCVSYQVIKWRGDIRCGSSFPLSDGSPAQCNPLSSTPCCAPSAWCGSTSAHCDCSGCTDYRD